MTSNIQDNFTKHSRCRTHRWASTAARALPHGLTAPRPRQRVIQALYQRLRLLCVEWHRRADLEYVMKRPVGTDQNAGLAHAIDDFGRFLRGRLQGVAAADELYTEKQARSAYVADQREALHEQAESCQQIRADFFGMCLQVRLMHNLQHLCPYGARDGATAEPAEEFPAVVEGCCDVGRRNNCADRIAIADGFAEHDDVRNDALLFKAVEILPESAVSGLNLIGNADAPCLADLGVHRRQIAFRK